MRFFLAIAPCALLGMGHAAIPILNTPIYNTPSIEVQVGTPLRTVRLELVFYMETTYLNYPDYCDAFVACAPPLVPPPVEPGPNQLPNLVDGFAPFVLGGGEYTNLSFPVRYVVGTFTNYAPELAGTLAIAPKGQIAQTNVLEINSEIFVHPDGSTERGMSMTLHPDGIVVEPGDVVVHFSHDANGWGLRPAPFFAGNPIDVATLYMDGYECGYPKLLELSSPSFAIVEDIIRSKVGSVVLVDNQLFVPCLERGAEDPLTHQLSFFFGNESTAATEGDQHSLFVNVRYSPAQSVTVTDGGVEYCPTLFVNTHQATNVGMVLVPEMFEGNITSFLDARNLRYVFRKNVVPREPLPADPVPLLPSFVLPDPASGSTQFLASDTPAWRLLSARPQIDLEHNGTLVYSLGLYNITNSPYHNVTADYPGVYFLVGSGEVDVSNPAMISLPVSLEGAGQRYRITQQLTSITATYTLTPVHPPVLVL